MGCYVLAVGGTGNKILESLVYLAALDGLYTLDEAGNQTPLPEVTLLSVDVDAACGNTTRAKRAAESYSRLQEAFRRYPAEHPGFHTALTLERWNMNLSRRAMSVDKMVENHRRDQLLSRTIFSRTESALEYSEGFRGHPDLGVLFFHDLLNSLDDLRREGQPRRNESSARSDPGGAGPGRAGEADPVRQHLRRHGRVRHSRRGPVPPQALRRPQPAL